MDSDEPLTQVSYWRHEQEKSQPLGIFQYTCAWRLLALFFVQLEDRTKPVQCRSKAVISFQDVGAAPLPNKEAPWQPIMALLASLWQDDGEWFECRSFSDDFCENRTKTDQCGDVGANFYMKGESAASRWCLEQK